MQVSKYRSKSYRYATATAGGLKRTDIERKPYVQPYRRRKGSVVGDTMASAEHEPITGVWGQSPQRGPGAEPLVRGASPPEAESILVIGCPTESANLAPVRESSMLCYGPLVSELGGPECMVPPKFPTPSLERYSGKTYGYPV